MGLLSKKIIKKKIMLVSNFLEQNIKTANLK